MRGQVVYSIFSALNYCRQEVHHTSLLLVGLSCNV